MSHVSIFADVHMMNTHVFVFISFSFRTCTQIDSVEYDLISAIGPAIDLTEQFFLNTVHVRFCKEKFIVIDQSCFHARDIDTRQTRKTHRSDRSTFVRLTYCQHIQVESNEMFDRTNEHADRSVTMYRLVFDVIDTLDRTVR
jgi:hypothetical protein